MNIQCKNCGTNHSIDSEKLPSQSKTARCKKCQSPMRVPGKQELAKKKSKVLKADLVAPKHQPKWSQTQERSLAHQESAIAVAAPPQIIRAGTPIERTKECGFCGESIKMIAKKCKHCGETLDATLRVAEEAQRAANQTGNVYMNASNAQPAQQLRPFPWLGHLLLTLLTLGWWAPVWILHYLFRNKNYYL